MEHKENTYISIKMDGEDFKIDVNSTYADLMLMLGAYVTMIETRTGLSFNEIIYFLKENHKMKNATKGGGADGKT